MAIDWSSFIAGAMFAYATVVAATAIYARGRR